MDRKEQGDYLFVRRRGEGRIESFGRESAETWARAHRYCAAYDAAVRTAKGTAPEQRGDILPLVFGSILGFEGIEHVLDEIRDR